MRRETFKNKINSRITRNIILCYPIALEEQKRNNITDREKLEDNILKSSFITYRDKYVVTLQKKEIDILIEEIFILYLYYKRYHKLYNDCFYYVEYPINNDTRHLEDDILLSSEDKKQLIEIEKKYNSTNLTIKLKQVIKDDRVINYKYEALNTLAYKLYEHDIKLLTSFITSYVMDKIFK